jgi:hypothetical protein
LSGREEEEELDDVESSPGVEKGEGRIGSREGSIALSVNMARRRSVSVCSDAMAQGK